MDEEIKAQLIPLIEDTKEGLAAAVEVLKEQAPLLIKELLWWEGVQSGVFFLIGIACLVVLAVTFKKHWRWALGQIDSSEGASLFGVIFPQMGLLGAGVPLVLCNLAWLQILIAPRVFLLEYVAKWV